jgi:hypothetical protein
MRARLATLVLVVASLAAVAAGCGGSDEEADPTAAWASGFCTAVTTWTDSLQDVLSQFSDTSSLSEDGLEEAANDARSSTEQLVDDLEALGAPDTESGEEVRSSLDTLSSTLESEVAEIESTVEGISGITGLPSAISTVFASLTAMGTAASATLQAIDSADVGGELQTALEDSPECAGIPG